MARRGDARSPSPTGSHRAGGRDDDRYPRNRNDDRRDGRGYRRRSRSRSPDSRRYNDRDRRRGRDRSADSRDYDRDHYRSSRDYRDRSRDRHYHRRDDSRDRVRRRENEQANTRRRGRRDGSRDSVRSVRSRDHGKGRDSPKNKGRENQASAEARQNNAQPRERARSPKPSQPTPKKQTDAEKKQTERLMRLEAWKAKQMAEQDRKQKEFDAKGSGTHAIFQAMDQKAAAEAAATAASAGTSAQSTPRDSPAPYAGKFDPKAFSRKASASQAASKLLGDDVVLPKSLSLPNQASKDDKTMLKRPKHRDGGLVGFGINNVQMPGKSKTTARSGIGFDDEVTTARKLEKLPTLSAEEQAEDAPIEDGQDDEDGEMIDATEEEIAAAERAAAERRADLLEAKPSEEVTQSQASLPMNVDDEDIDPLDAYMAGLAQTVSNPAIPSINSRKRKLQTDELQTDEGDVFDAIENSNPDDILAMAATRTKKKDLPTVNHKNIEYEDVKFSFYKPPEELANMTEEDVKDLRLELSGIRIRGNNCPVPIQNWSQCGLGVQTMDVINKLKYNEPTAIQAQAIPAIMSGRDVIGVAKTGSGKTIAYLLPMFRHIKDQRPLESMEGPIALVIAPTRELATQIHRDCKPFLKALDLRAACTYGGAPIKDQIADLKRGAELIVCTPGRMIELLAANSGRVTNLRRVTYVVLDEADRMFDMGFEPQITKILDQIRPKRQTVLFSATFPVKMESLARKVLKQPLEIQVGGRSIVAPEITQMVEVRPEDTKFLRLLELLGKLYEDEADVRTLIFVERQESADNLLGELMRRGYPCMSIHGGKDQVDRDSTISDFKNGVFPVLVATSVAARGLDVSLLKLVVNYDPPNHLEDYVHRVGRTGRAGNTGTAVTFITEDQGKYAANILKALKQSGTEVPEDLQKLSDSFNDKVKLGQAKWAGGGFGGRGIEKYDELHDAARARERKAYKTGDEPEEDVDIEKKAGFTDDIVIKSRDDPAAAAATTTTTAAAAVPEKPVTPAMPKGLELDESSIVVHRTETDPSGAAGNALDAVKRAAERISGRLIQRGKIHPGQPIDNRGPDAGAFHATLEINDFPQKARWAVTNRTNVAKILEATGTSITTKGTYYGTGKEPGPNDAPKLYILVEGDTEIVVRNAMSELMRLLKEGTMAAADSEAKAPVGGRYKVI